MKYNQPISSFQNLVSTYVIVWHAVGLCLRRFRLEMQNHLQSVGRPEYFVLQAESSLDSVECHIKCPDMQITPASPNLHNSLQRSYRHSELSVKYLQCLSCLPS
jgi:hypothetical protein